MPNFRHRGGDRFTCDLFGTPVDLVRDRTGTWSLVGPGERAVRLDADEAAAAFRLGQRLDEEGILAAAGLQQDPSLTRDPVVAEVDEHAVLLDTTTAQNAAVALDGTMDAFSLLDLSTVTSALVLHDTVVLQHDRGPGPNDLASAFSDAVYILPMTRTFIVDTLWSMEAQLEQLLKPGSADLAYWNGIWNSFFGRRTVSLNMRDVNRAQDSPFHWDGVPASYYVALVS